MQHAKRKLNMYEPAVFEIRIQGVLNSSWAQYFEAQSIIVERDEAENAVTVIMTEPIDQGELVGLINYLNTLGVALISMEGKPVE